MKYAVHGYLTISCFAFVEADSEQEARDKAEALSAPMLCHQCDGGGDNEGGEWMLNGWGDIPDDCIQAVDRCGSAPPKGGE